MKILAFCSMMFWCLALNAATPEGPTLDGTYWSTLDANAKVAFLRGCRATAEVFPASDRFNSHTEWIPGLSSQIDAFYRNKDHVVLRLGYTVQICLLQANHEPQAKIDVLLQAAYKEAQRPNK